MMEQGKAATLRLSLIHIYALSYLGHLNAAGADGVIVQDIGLAHCLTEWGRQVPGMKPVSYTHLGKDRHLLHE